MTHMYQRVQRAGSVISSDESSNDVGRVGVGTPKKVVEEVIVAITELTRLARRV
jgi:hypothetical protein